MNRRHGITALLTLLALVVSFTGTAFASACAAPASEASTAAHGEHGGVPERPAHNHDSEQPMPNCPMSMTAGCATAPSLTADVSLNLVAAPEVILAAVAADEVLEHIRSNIIFHPPRF